MGDKSISQTVSTYLQWIAERAAGSKDWKFMSLANHIDPEMLYEAYKTIRKNAKPGVDGETAEEFALNLTENLKELHRNLRENKYRAPLIKRVWLEKSDGGKRAIGMPTFKDKIVQKAVHMVLEPIYEEDFYDFSYGFRRYRRPHDALKVAREMCMDEKCYWIIDADIQGYFDNIDHNILQEFIGRRVTDGAIKRLIGKWLNAGIKEEDTVHYPEKGAPQGGSLSPLLSNIYLHYVLDEWFVKEVKPRIRGKAYLIRFCDDFIIGCEQQDDAEKIYRVLKKRMRKYKLQMHPEKTRMIDFRRPANDGVKRETFDFLGFTHYWGKSKRGYWVVKRKTKRKKISQKKKEINDWCRKNRHKPVKEQHRHLCQVLRGHFNYFGVISNSRSMWNLRYWTMRIWKKWLNRRGGKKYLNWEKFTQIMETYTLPKPRTIHSI